MKKLFAISKLKELGYKITPQREYILDLFLESKDHPSAEFIYKVVKEKFPYISLSTVYNTLNTLVDIGLARIIFLEDKSYFDPNLEPHSHFICDNCGKIYDIESIPINITNLKNENITRINGFDIYVYGICRNCAKITLN